MGKILLSVKLFQKFCIGFGFLQFVNQRLCTLFFVKQRYHSTEHGDFFHRIFVDEQFIVACTGCLNVNRRGNSLVCKRAVQLQLHASGAFEFFVDQVVHTRLGANQRSADNGEASTFFTISRGAQKLFSRVQSCGIKSA